jgi:hypothetical protein
MGRYSAKERRRVMSKALGMRFVWGLCGVLAGVFGFAPDARAEVTSDTSGSIMVYPKVVYSGGRDTVIQLSNTSNNVVYAHCFYMDAAPLNGRPRWAVTDFRVVLTRQQPTHWVVSQGRQVNNGDNFTDPVQDGAGLDPGAIPPVPEGFMGELKCVQVDASGTPFGGNNLKGEAVLVTLEGDVSKHNALAITANPDLASDGDPDELLLNNTAFNDGEYNSCPETLLVDHFADGASACGEEDGEDCPIRPYITLVPCSQDFENLIPEQVTVQFEIINEFETIFSTSTTVDCWLMTRLADLDTGTGTCSVSATACAGDADCNGGIDLCSKPLSIFSFTVLGTNSALTTITPVDLDGGVIGIGEEQHYATSGDSAWTAWNLHQSGTRYDATIDTEGGPKVDRIRIPTFF